MLYLQLPAILTLFVSYSSCFPSEQQTPLYESDKSPFTPDFDENVHHLLDLWRAPGLSIAVIDGNETFSKGYGIASFPSTPVTTSTLFYTGSTTKAFTAAALALLIDDSSNSSTPLAWNTPISSIIGSDFLLPDDYATLHVTLEDAASHRTGMPGHDSSYGGPDFDLRDAVRNLRNLPMTAEIRTRWQYCNMMYMTLSHVIETLTSSWLGDVLWARIWKPLGMTRTYLSLPQAKKASENGSANLAVGYLWNNRTQKYMETPWMDIPLVSGAGNIISNVEDYAKWLRFLIDQSPPLSSTGHQSLHHPRAIIQDSPVPGIIGPSTYALGWNIEIYRGELLITHSGGVPGFGTMVGFFPRRSYGIVMMGNTAEGASIVEQILFYQLLDDYLDIPQPDRGDIAAVLEDILLKPKLKELEDPIRALFPNAPRGEDALPLSLRLDEYAGVYFNPGYRNFTLTLSSSASDSSRPSSMLIALSQHSLQSVIDRVWAFRFVFEHVSGEYFIVKGFPDMPDDEVDMMDPLHVLLIKAEFRLGEDGEVKEVGLGLEPQMGEEKIWFRRLAGVQAV